MANFNGKAVAVCTQCYRTFYLTADEMAVLPNSSSRPDRYKRTGKDAIVKENILKTWTDWIEYLQTNCPQCRVSEPPSQCVEDYEKHLKKIGRRG